MASAKLIMNANNDCMYSEMLLIPLCGALLNAKTESLWPREREREIDRDKNENRERK